MAYVYTPARVPSKNQTLDILEGNGISTINISENGNVPPRLNCTNFTADFPISTLPSVVTETENNFPSDFTSETETLFDNPRITEPVGILNNLRAKYPDQPIIAQININFLEKKFEPLLSLVKDKIDILMISETKIDGTFPFNQFVIDGYSQQFRLDRNCNGGGIIIYVRDHIPCKQIKTYSLPEDVEAMFIEITLGKTNWLLVGGYNPRKENISHFLSHISNGIDKNLPTHENFLVIGDFNCPVSVKAMKDFCEIYDFENLIKNPLVIKTQKILLQLMSC